MNKRIIILGISAMFLLWSCGSGNSRQGSGSTHGHHDHETEEVHDHHDHENETGRSMTTMTMKMKPDMTTKRNFTDTKPTCMPGITMQPERPDTAMGQKQPDIRTK